MKRAGSLRHYLIILAHSGVSPATPALYGQAYVVNLYSLLAILSLGVFGLAHITIEPEHHLGMLELAGCSAIALNALALRWTRNVRLARNGFLLGELVMLVAMLGTGGTQGTGIFWFFVFPVSAFFMGGKRSGAAWTAGLGAATLALLVFAQHSEVSLAYTTVELRQMLIVLAVVSVGIYVYEQSRQTLATQTHQSQQALLAEKIRAETILENVDEGIVAVDANGVVVSVNQAAASMLGRPAAELMGRHFTEVLPAFTLKGAPVPSSQRPLQHALQTSSRADKLLAYQHKDGSLFPVAAMTRAIVVGGKAVGAIGTFRDITAEQEVERAKSEFVTLASHQLRTPVSAIAWFTEMLLHGDAGRLRDEQRDYIEQIDVSNQRSAAIIDAMLIVSSLDLGPIDVRPEPLELMPLARRLLREQVRQNAGRKKLSIIEEYNPGVPALPLDPQLTKVILQNLFSNAVKYTPAGGTITVGIALSSEKLIPKSRGSVAITVADTGYGIGRADQKKIFAKLFRAGNIKAKDTDGTGLGLYIVKAVLGQVGGRVRFSSQENKGSVFTVLLPLEGMPAQAAVPQLVSATKETGNV